MSYLFEQNAHYYLIIFCLVILLTYIGSYEIKHSHKKIGFLFYCISILILSIFTGARDVTVGTDVNVYVIPQLELAKYLHSFVPFMVASNSEFLYKILVYVISFTSQPIFNLLFIQQLITLLPLYIVLYKRRFAISTTFGITVYLFIIYNMSLSVMRQCMAASLILLGYIFFEDNKKKATLVLFVLAVLLHNSAIIFLAFLFVYYKAKSGKYSLIKGVTLVGIIILIVLCLDQLLMFAVTHGFVRQGVYDRLQLTQGGLSIGEFLFRLFLTGLPFLFNKIGKSKDNSTYISLAFIGTLFSVLAIISTYLIRISYYFYFFMPLSIPLSLKFFKRNYVNRIILYSIYIIVMLLYWYIVYVGWQWYDTVPFMFSSKL